MSVEASAPAPGGAVTGASYTAFLAQLSFLSGVPAEDLATFAGNVLVRNLEPGRDVVVQRQYGHAMFVIVSGAVVVHAIGPNDEPVTLGRIERPGDFFGEAALLGRGERTATVTTATDVVLLEIEKHRFDLLSRRHKSVRDHLEGVYHARAIATYTRTHRYLSQLDEQSKKDIILGAKLKMYKRGDVAAKKGESANTVLVVKDGVLKATRTASDGTQSILCYFNTNDVVGMHDDMTRKYELGALGACEIIAYPRDAFSMAMARNAEVAAHFGKDDMHRRAAMAQAGGTVFEAAQAFLQAGVEVESLLVINLDRCVRCGNCVRACHSRHEYTRLDRRGPIFRRRAALKEGKHEHLMLPSSCRHCRDPECMIGCPTGAIQRFADGDVDINDNCIGCENCARKCPYGNITMRPLAEKDRPSPEIVKKAIKCNLCRGYGYSNCVHECPRGALLRVDPLRYFEELALVMEAEQRDAIEWSRGQAKNLGTLGAKQKIRPRSTWFVPTSFILGLLAIVGIVGASVLVKTGQLPGPLRGGTKIGLLFGAIAGFCLFAAAGLGVRKRLRNTPLGQLEPWTQFHMMFGLVGFIAALAHAGYNLTGVFTSALILVFALEVATGVAGQIIYMTVPKTLTQLERYGTARLVEDLVEEQVNLEKSITELIATVPPDLWKDLDGRIKKVVGPVSSKFKKSYDAKNAAKKNIEALNVASAPEAHRGTVQRLVESRTRLSEVQAQIRLHSTLKTWLVAHVAIASALVVMLVFHVVTALTVLA